MLLFFQEAGGGEEEERGQGPEGQGGGPGRQNMPTTTRKWQMLNVFRDFNLSYLQHNRC